MSREIAVTSISLIVDADYEAFQTSSGVAFIVRLKPQELATVHINLDAVGTTDNFEYLILGGSKMATGGTYDAVTDASNVDLDTVVHPMTTDDEFVGIYLVQTNGGEAGEFRLIIDSSQGDDGVTLDHALSGTPSVGETYDLYRLGAIQAGTIVPLTTVTIDNPQNVITSVLGPEYIVVLGRSAGATDAHLAYMTVQKNGVT